MFGYHNGCDADASLESVHLKVFERTDIYDEVYCCKPGLHGAASVHIYEFNEKSFFCVCVWYFAILNFITAYTKKYHGNVNDGVLFSHANRFWTTLSWLILMR